MQQRMHYEDSNDFFELFDADTFDKETDDGMCWQGLWEDYDGTYTVGAEFLRDAAGSDSGTGWYLEEEE